MESACWWGTLRCGLIKAGFSVLRRQDQDRHTSLHQLHPAELQKQVGGHTLLHCLPLCGDRCIVCSDF